MVYEAEGRINLIANDFKKSLFMLHAKRKMVEGESKKVKLDNAEK